MTASFYAEVAAAYVRGTRGRRERPPTCARRSVRRRAREHATSFTKHVSRGLLTRTKPGKKGGRLTAKARPRTRRGDRSMTASQARKRNRWAGIEKRGPGRWRAQVPRTGWPRAVEDIRPRGRRSPMARRATQLAPPRRLDRPGARQGTIRRIRRQVDCDEVGSRPFNDGEHPLPDRARTSGRSSLTCR